MSTRREHCWEGGLFSATSSPEGGLFSDTSAPEGGLFSATSSPEEIELMNRNQRT